MTKSLNTALHVISSSLSFLGLTIEKNLPAKFSYPDIRRTHHHELTYISAADDA